VPKPGIIVVGASAGGVEALQVLAAGVPANLDASVFVVFTSAPGSTAKAICQPFSQRQENCRPCNQKTARKSNWAKSMWLRQIATFCWKKEAFI